MSERRSSDDGIAFLEIQPAAAALSQKPVPFIELERYLQPRANQLPPHSLWTMDCVLLISKKSRIIWI